MEIIEEPLNAGKTRQWINLGAAAFMHAVSDSFAGVLPVAMPLICERFDIGKARGIWLLAIFGITCNWGQLLVGHLRPHRERPLFAPIGLVLLGGMCFVGFLPAREATWPILWWIVAATGLGVAFTHPEGLRIAHGLDELPDAMTTTVFLQGGFVGFSGAGLLGGVVLEQVGLHALAAFIIGPVLALALLYVLRLRLGVEKQKQDAVATIDSDRRLSFWAIMVMTVPTATASATIVNLVPIQGRELEFAHSYGGTAVALIGAGGAAGSFLWATLSRRRPLLHCSTAALLAGVPFLAAYQLLAGYPWAVWFLLPGALCSFAAFPLMVSLARHARGLNLGGRMSVVIGGSWGIAGLVLAALGGIAESVGVRAILNLAWIGHLISGMVGLVYILLGRVDGRPGTEGPS